MVRVVRVVRVVGCALHYFVVVVVDTANQLFSLNFILFSYSILYISDG